MLDTNILTMIVTTVVFVCTMISVFDRPRKLNLIYHNLGLMVCYTKTKGMSDKYSTVKDSMPMFFLSLYDEDISTIIAIMTGFIFAQWFLAFIMFVDSLMGYLDFPSLVFLPNQWVYVSLYLIGWISAIILQYIRTRQYRYDIIIQRITR